MSKSTGRYIKFELKGEPGNVKLKVKDKLDQVNEQEMFLMLATMNTYSQAIINSLMKMKGGRITQGVDDGKK